MKHLIAAMFTFGLVAASSMANALTWEERREAQVKLKEAGHDPGAIDGALGSDTRKAIRAYQADNDLRVTGRLDDATVAKLDLGSGSADSDSGDEAEEPAEEEAKEEEVAEAEEAAEESEEAEEAEEAPEEDESEEAAEEDDSAEEEEADEEEADEEEAEDADDEESEEDESDEEESEGDDEESASAAGEEEEYIGGFFEVGGNAASEDESGDEDESASEEDDSEAAEDAEDESETVATKSADDEEFIGGFMETEGGSDAADVDADDADGSDTSDINVADAGADAKAALAGAVSGADASGDAGAINVDDVDGEQVEADAPAAPALKTAGGRIPHRGFSYAEASLLYTSLDGKNDDETFTGARLAGAYQITEEFAVRGQLEGSGNGDFPDRKRYTFRGVEAIYQPFSQVYFGAGIFRATAELDDLNANGTGIRLTVGTRGPILHNLEYQVEGNWMVIDEFDNKALGVDGRVIYFPFTELPQLGFTAGASYENLGVDDGSTYNLNVGVRFHYD